MVGAHQLQQATPQRRPERSAMLPAEWLGGWSMRVGVGGWERVEGSGHEHGT